MIIEKSDCDANPEIMVPIKPLIMIQLKVKSDLIAQINLSAPVQSRDK